MTQVVTKVPVKSEPAAGSTPAPTRAWDSLQILRHEIDHVFESFNRGLRLFPLGRPMVGDEPTWPRAMTQGMVPAMDIAEGEKGYQLTAELPGLAERNIEVKLSNGTLTIRGEKAEEKEEQKQDYHLSERRYGSFQRAFPLPADVDTDKIEASFKNGVLTVVLPKTVEAIKSEKKIDVKAA
ncbi:MULTISPECIES: Hsp20/alpha crystallin family protein [Inquilinus]|uniref:HSP20 family protein n=1 Tax=Inquilinus ginsengisoli TaxID=363840 RepID=A0ABU1JJH1_9PROT|nr:Hsp20/alpha crystallin family protein [Inquilinus ginsengisoli]MDR6288179.1 HSP20 family protein [Inquilinus ginsengisoli]